MSELKWSGREAAKKWPEGCAILWRRPMKQYGKQFRYESSGWYRPDWVDSGYYGEGDEQYLLLEKPVKE